MNHVQTGVELCCDCALKPDAALVRIWCTTCWDLEGLELALIIGGIVGILVDPKVSASRRVQQLQAEKSASGYTRLRAAAISQAGSSSSASRRCLAVPNWVNRGRATVSPSWDT